MCNSWHWEYSQRCASISRTCSSSQTETCDPSNNNSTSSSSSNPPLFCFMSLGSSLFEVLHVSRIRQYLSIRVWLFRLAQRSWVSTRSFKNLDILHKKLNFCFILKICKVWPHWTHIPQDNGLKPIHDCPLERCSNDSIRPGTGSLLSIYPPCDLVYVSVLFHKQSSLIPEEMHELIVRKKKIRIL